MPNSLIFSFVSRHISAFISRSLGEVSENQRAVKSNAEKTLLSSRASKHEYGPVRTALRAPSRIT